MFMRSFNAPKSQKRKKTVFFALLGSARVKASRKALRDEIYTWDFKNTCPRPSLRRFFLEIPTYFENFTINNQIDEEKGQIYLQ